MAAPLRLGWIVVPMGVLLIGSIAGSVSAWVAGSARMMFVCGPDRYLPRALGEIHPDVWDAAHRAYGVWRALHR